MRRPLCKQNRRLKWAAYLGYLVMFALGDPLADAYGRALVLGAVPLAGIALAALALREWAASRGAGAEGGPGGSAG